MQALTMVHRLLGIEQHCNSLFLYKLLNLWDFKRSILDGHRQLLVDCGVTSASRYSKTREGLRSDARYKAMPRDAREPAFKQYTAELQVCCAPAFSSTIGKQWAHGRRCSCGCLLHCKQEPVHHSTVNGLHQTLCAQQQAQVVQPNSRMLPSDASSICKMWLEPKMIAPAWLHKIALAWMRVAAMLHQPYAAGCLPTQIRSSQLANAVLSLSCV